MISSYNPVLHEIVQLFIYNRLGLCFLTTDIVINSNFCRTDWKMCPETMHKKRSARDLVLVSSLLHLSVQTRANVQKQKYFKYAVVNIILGTVHIRMVNIVISLLLQYIQWIDSYYYHKLVYYSCACAGLTEIGQTFSIFY